MIKPILTEPNPVLRQRSKEIDLSAIESEEIKKAIQDMKETLAGSEDGIGIAAPQIGIPYRIFIVSEESKYIEVKERPERTDWKNYVYINPIITKYSAKKTEAIEGCLSVPKKYGLVKRPEKISVEAVDENGNKISHGAAKFFARVIQHEMDHLDGILFIDKVSRFIEVNKEESKL